MAGFANVRQLVNSFDNGKSWISTFRKVPSASATIAGQWLDYSYTPGNPIPNYYAASPLQANVLESEKGIYIPRMSLGSKQFLHRFHVMVSGANAAVQQVYLLDYLLYYPFVDMDAAGETQSMINYPSVGTYALPRYTDGIGVQMMVVAQSNTVGGGTFTITYTDSDNQVKTTENITCAAAQPSGAIVSANTASGGLTPFVRLVAGTKGIKNIVSVNFSVANGGLCAIVLVMPIDVTMALESVSVAGAGTAVEREALSQRAGIVEIKDGAFLSFVGRGMGSLASSPLVGLLETVWR